MTKFVPKADLDKANTTIDRLSADCDRYMAERDEAVAQHDADAALIAELRAQVEASYAERSEPEPSLSWRLRATANRLSNASTDDRDYYHLVNDLIDEADRLERERSESAEREQRIEKAAQVLRAVDVKNGGGEPWDAFDDYSGLRRRYRGRARALDDVGMLTGGDT
ncbi:hypothetical protein [Gordonia tangerina]|uniref:Uncharacterized protein n=1 Tax=Gordonia tangerina TaxID=2911060 RepID=A0ABS9DLI2_9ACTN|nr:hypothetical protein [Gordonia tangerina]MCF3939941.1 hypothetical protein [Gordonia tangerina]